MASNVWPTTDLTLLAWPTSSLKDVGWFRSSSQLLMLAARAANLDFLEGGTGVAIVFGSGELMWCLGAATFLGESSSWPSEEIIRICEKKITISQCSTWLITCWLNPILSFVQSWLRQTYQVTPSGVCNRGHDMQLCERLLLRTISYKSITQWSVYLGFVISALSVVLYHTCHVWWFMHWVSLSPTLSYTHFFQKPFHSLILNQDNMCKHCAPYPTWSTPNLPLLWQALHTSSYRMSCCRLDRRWRRWAGRLMGSRLLHWWRRLTGDLHRWWGFHTGFHWRSCEL